MSEAEHGRGANYDLTGMGRALVPVCDALGQWGTWWLEIEPRHLAVHDSGAASAYTGP